MISERLPTKTAEAILSLQGDSRFREIVSWLQAELDSTREENDFLTDIKLTRNQGCAITLNRILKDFEGNEGSRKRGNTQFTY